MPFCLSKCKYCGFYSQAEGDEKKTLSSTGDKAAAGSPLTVEAYKKSLLEDIEEYSRVYEDCNFIVDTVFFGGGTPSILPHEFIGEIIAALRKGFTFVKGQPEISIEANPKTLTADKLKAYREYGINRLSIGVQSFDNRMLEFLGRAHRAEDAAETFKLAREQGFDNINLDLMFGLPNQTMNSWRDSLDKVLSLKPEHLSLYSLQLEEGTELFRMFENGEFAQLSDELDRDMYHYALERLNKEGYDHYEISNWALRKDLRCRHNLKYWDLSEYLGLGPSAASYVNGVRFSEEPGFEYRENSLEDNAAELAFTALRTGEGIDRQLFCERIGVSFEDVFPDIMKRLEEHARCGRLEIDDRFIRLTEKGIDTSNQIMSLFV